MSLKIVLDQEFMNEHLQHVKSILYSSAIIWPGYDS